MWAAIGAAMCVVVATGAWPTTTGAWPMTAGAVRIGAGAAKIGAANGAGCNNGACKAGAANGSAGASKPALAQATEAMIVRATKND